MKFISPLDKNLFHFITCLVRNLFHLEPLFKTNSQFPNPWLKLEFWFFIYIFGKKEMQESEEKIILLFDQSNAMKIQEWERNQVSLHANEVNDNEGGNKKIDFTPVCKVVSLTLAGNSISHNTKRKLRKNIWNTYQCS